VAPIASLRGAPSANGTPPSLSLMPRSVVAAPTPSASASSNGNSNGNAMDARAFCAQFVASLKEEGLSKSTCSTYKRGAADFLKVSGWTLRALVNSSKVELRREIARVHPEFRYKQMVDYVSIVNRARRYASAR